MRHHALAGAVLAAVVLAAGAAAAGLGGIRSGPLSVFSYPVKIVVDSVPATVDIKPETLQRNSQGDHVTVFIELPEGLSVEAIEGDSLLLCAGGSACVRADSTQVVSGGRVLKAEFDRGAVIALVDDVDTPATVRFTVSGVVSATRFTGSAEVKLLG